MKRIGKFLFAWWKDTGNRSWQSSEDLDSEWKAAKEKTPVGYPRCRCYICKREREEIDWIEELARDKPTSTILPHTTTT
jgi:hypothetical protein